VTLFRLIVWRHLLAEPLRTSLTVLGIGLGVAVYVAVATANIEVLRTFEEGVLGVAGRTTLQITSAAALPEGFDEQIIRTVRQADGVMVAAPVLEFAAVWRGDQAVPVALPILGVDLLAESAVRDYTIASANASPFRTEESRVSGDPDWERYLEPDSIMIGRAFARRHGLDPGGFVDLRVGALVRRLVVRGVIEGRGPRGAALEELAVMDIASAQLTFDRLGQLDRIDVVSDPARSIDEVASTLRQRLPSGLLVKRPEQRNAQMERMTRAFRLNVASLSAVALLVGLFLVYNTMSFAVLRRRREIGILRSLGMLPQGVSRLFLLEGLLLGMVGWAVGVLGGIFLARIAVRMMATTAGNLYDMAVSPSSAILPLAVVVQSFLIGIGVAIFGSLGPIREASAVEPVRALAPKGYETDMPKRVVPVLLKSMAVLVMAGVAALAGPVQGLPLFGYLSAFLLIMAFAMLSSVIIRVVSPSLRAILPGRYGMTVRVAAAELERAPIRNAVAVSALMVGFALMSGMTILIQSFRHSVDVWLEQTVKADVIVAGPTWLGSGPPGLLPESVRQRLIGIPGVEAVDAYRDVRTEFRDRPVALVARDLLLHARHSRYIFLEGDSSVVLTRAVQNDEVIISETFANQFGLHKGDLIRLPSPGAPVEFLIGGVFYDYATDGGKVVMDRTLYQRYWRDPNLTVVPLYLAAGVDPEKIRGAVLERLAGDPPVLVITNSELKGEVLRIFDQTFRVTYALELIALLVALLGIVNALLSGILERQSELAVMRAVGATPAQIGRIILWESGLLGVSGIILGVAAGFLLSILLIQVVNKQSFGWSIAFHPSSAEIVMAMALALITTLVAGYGAARRAANLPLAESLQYE
jgi:putative ABC transport system permease protein